MRVSSFAPLVLLLAFFWSIAAEAQVNKSDFWKVDLAGPQQVTVLPGDMILVKSPTLPLVPANLKKTFAVDYDHSRLRLIAEEPPEGEGRMAKHYYLLTLAPGSSEVTVQIRDQGQVVEAVTLKVTCR